MHHSWCNCKKLDLIWRMKFVHFESTVSQYTLSLRRVFVLAKEIVCSRMQNKVSSLILPRSIKTEKPVLERSKMPTLRKDLASVFQNTCFVCFFYFFVIKFGSWFWTCYQKIRIWFFCLPLTLYILRLLNIQWNQHFPSIFKAVGDDCSP